MDRSRDPGRHHVPMPFPLMQAEQQTDDQTNSMAHRCISLNHTLSRAGYPALRIARADWSI